MARNQTTGWVGWVYFAGAMMLVIGGLQAISGLVALFKNSYFVVSQGQLLVFDYTQWGWINLILGVLVFCAGLAVLSGQTWGRIVGVVMAVLSAIANLSFMSAYPAWSLIGLTIDVLVIYALTVHGAEAKN